MRCQKARSCLSAYCRDELSGQALLAIREHLAGCASCRREEAVVRSLFAGAKAMKSPNLSADFNAKLLNRIAQERFAETRTEAYLPKRAPLFSWPRLVPVAAVALVAVFAVIGTNYIRSTHPQAVPSEQTASLDNSYLTVQPDQNPNMAARVDKNWSFRSQLAQTERMNRLSGVLTSSTGFAASEPRVVLQLIVPEANANGDIIGFTIRPIVRTYEPAGNTQVKETQTVY